jgi:hypothetical protein
MANIWVFLQFTFICFAERRAARVPSRTAVSAMREGNGNVLESASGDLIPILRNRFSIFRPIGHRRRPPEFGNTSVQPSAQQVRAVLPPNCTKMTGKNANLQKIFVRDADEQPMRWRPAAAARYPL